MAPMISAIQRSSDRGACGIVFCALAPNLENGRFYRECKLAKDENEQVDKLAEDGALQKLWEVSEECEKKVV